jgi:spore coat polysaccharide biosynthesis protein SpsF (cytidylyltransferase family)
VIEMEITQRNGKIFRGSENNVLDRYFQAAKIECGDIIVRITADCPLVDHELVDEIVVHALEKNLDYCSNTLIETYPDGMDVEVFKYDVLQFTHENTNLLYQQEHVTPFMKENSTFFGMSLFSSENHVFLQDYSKVRLTIDRYEDYQVLEILVNKLGMDATWKEYADYYTANEMISKINSGIVRNEGFKKN